MDEYDLRKQERRGSGRRGALKGVQTSKSRHNTQRYYCCSCCSVGGGRHGESKSRKRISEMPYRNFIVTDVAFSSNTEKLHEVGFRVNKPHEEIRRTQKRKGLGYY